MTPLYCAQIHTNTLLIDRNPARLYNTHQFSRFLEKLRNAVFPFF